MVMPSSAIVAPFRPHIGSEVGGGTRSGAIPESQWPALQHGIVSDDALAIGNSGATNESATKRHNRHNATRASSLCLMNFFAAIVMSLLARIWRQSFSYEFHLHFGQLPGDLEVTSSCMGQT